MKTAACLLACGLLLTLAPSSLAVPTYGDGSFNPFEWASAIVFSQDFLDALKAASGAGGLPIGEDLTEVGGQCSWHHQCESNQCIAEGDFNVDDLDTKSLVDDGTSDGRCAQVDGGHCSTSVDIPALADESTNAANTDAYCASGRCDDNANVCFKSGLESCTADKDCASGECKYGKCTSLHHNPCKVDHDCKYGGCNFETMRCKAPSGTDCTTNFECASGTCDLGDTDTCLKSGGEQCSSDNQCASDKCNKKKWECTKKAWEKCSSDEECSSGACSYLGCLGDIGDACATNDQCVSGVCDTSENKIHAHRSDDIANLEGDGTCRGLAGAECEADDDCVSGYCNRALDFDHLPEFHNICQSLSGQKCASDLDCASQKCGPYGTCLKQFTESCKSDHECASGECGVNTKKCLGSLGDECTAGQTAGTAGDRAAVGDPLCASGVCVFTTDDTAAHCSAVPGDFCGLYLHEDIGTGSGENEISTKFNVDSDAEDEDFKRCGFGADSAEFENKETTCHPVSMRCLLVDGSRCDHSSDCFSGACSDSGWCLGSSDGDDCVNDADCARNECSLHDKVCLGELGDPCITHADCKSGGCNLNAQFDHKMVCVSAGDAGYPCTVDGHCHSGSCGPEVTSAAGVTTRGCVLPGEKGSSCSVKAHCNDGLLCATDPAVIDQLQGTCQPKGQYGAPCSSVNGCDDGFTCHDDAFCAVSRGEVCANVGDGAEDVCNDGSTVLRQCDSEGLCPPP